MKAFYIAVVGTLTLALIIGVVAFTSYVTTPKPVAVQPAPIEHKLEKKAHDGPKKAEQHKKHDKHDR
jgi:hypothetical protein